MKYESNYSGLQSPIESAEPVEDSSFGDYALLRNGTGPVRNIMEGALKLEDLACGESSNSLQALVATAEPGFSCWEGKTSDGGKWYHILEGTLEVFAHNASHVLSEGDSIYVESTTPHIWRNPGRRTAKVLMLSSPSPLAADQTDLVA
jgi:hypothetical protein